MTLYAVEYTRPLFCPLEQAWAVNSIATSPWEQVNRRWVQILSSEGLKMQSSKYRPSMRKALLKVAYILTPSSLTFQRDPVLISARTPWGWLIESNCLHMKKFWSRLGADIFSAAEQTSCLSLTPVLAQPWALRIYYTSASSVAPVTAWDLGLALLWCPVPTRYSCMV